MSEIRETPWGFAQTTLVVAPVGLVWVSTASHGGLRVDLEVEPQLSEAARNRGERSCGALWYEEDIAWEIAVYELRETWPVMFGSAFFVERPADPEKDLFDSLSRWFPDYLLEIGQTPEPEAYRRFLAEAEQMQAHHERVAKEGGYN